MRGLDELLIDLCTGLPHDVGNVDAGVAVHAVSIELEVPVESAIGKSAELHACLPRGLMTTGFQLPLSRLCARFDRRLD
jgi:hypothetical protein